MRRTKKRTFGQILGSSCMAIFLANSTAAAAENETKDPEIERLEDEKKRLQLEVDISNHKKTLRENEKAARDEITGALPSFEGKTTINKGALDIESHLLAMVAVKSAALKIKQDLGITTEKGVGYIVAPHGDVLSEWQSELMLREIKGYGLTLREAREAVQPKRNAALAGGLPTALSAINGIGGLLRTTTTVDPLSLTAIDDNFLAVALKAELPEATLSSLNSLSGDLPKNTVFLAFEALQEEISEARIVIQNSPAQQPEKVKTLKSRFDQTVAFRNEITKSGAENTPSALIRAAMTKKILSENSKLLRVKVVKVGGSAVRLDNIGVFFGDDPLRVSAGLVASWTLEGDSKPDQTPSVAGSKQKAGYVFCWTAPKSFRKIQRGHWLRNNFKLAEENSGESLCRSAGKLGV